MRNSGKEKKQSLDGDDYCYRDDFPHRHLRYLTVRQAISELVS